VTVPDDEERSLEVVVNDELGGDSET